jgi:uncharacterized protein YhbP (UPF0306 family)
MADVREMVREFLQADQVMQLATSREGQPWICTVHFVADDAGHLYWTSTRDRRHSQELAANPRAAVAVVHNEVKPQAVQMAGQVEEVAQEDLAKVHGRYCEKFGPKDKFLAEIESGERAYYVFAPAETVLFDVVNFPADPRQELR